MPQRRDGRIIKGPAADIVGWAEKRPALLADRDQRGRVSEGIEMNCVITGRPDTSAIWAPNMDGFLCDEHATGGVRRNHS